MHPLRAGWAGLACNVFKVAPMAGVKSSRTQTRQYLHIGIAKDLLRRGRVRAALPRFQRPDQILQARFNLNGAQALVTSRLGSEGGLEALKVSGHAMSTLPRTGPHPDPFPVPHLRNCPFSRSWRCAISSRHRLRKPAARSKRACTLIPCRCYGGKTAVRIPFRRVCHISRQ